MKDSPGDNLDSFIAPLLPETCMNRDIRRPHLERVKAEARAEVKKILEKATEMRRQKKGSCT